MRQDLDTPDLTPRTVYWPILRHSAPIVIRVTLSVPSEGRITHNPSATHPIPKIQQREIML